MQSDPSRRRTSDSTSSRTSEGRRRRVSRDVYSYEKGGVGVGVARPPTHPGVLSVHRSPVSGRTFPRRVTSPPFKLRRCGSWEGSFVSVAARPLGRGRCTRLGQRLPTRSGCSRPGVPEVGQDPKVSGLLSVDLWSHHSRPRRPEWLLVPQRITLCSGTPRRDFTTPDLGRRSGHPGRSTGEESGCLLGGTRPQSPDLSLEVPTSCGSDTATVIF